MINKKLQQELLSMMEADQKMRFAAMKRKIKWDFNIDRNNTIKLKKIVKKYGWPDIPMVGKKGSVAAWILAQHADHDLNWQKKCLKLIKKSHLNGGIESKYLALMTDRVLTGSGKWQLYGTQFHVRNGKLFEKPIKDKKNLSKRRKEFGLEPFSIYKKKTISSYAKYSKK